MSLSSLTPASGSSADSMATPRSMLAGVQENERLAWERLVRLYGPLVAEWCRLGGLQTADVADVVQEVFLAVARHVRGFVKHAPGDTFRGWLRSITRNKIVDHHRRRSREPGGEGGTQAGTRWAQLPDEPGLPEEAGPAEAAAERDLLARGLELVRGEFEAKTWQAFWSTAIEARPAKDVGLDLGMSAGAVRVAKSRVLQRLRDALGDLAG